MQQLAENSHLQWLETYGLDLMSSLRRRCVVSDSAVESFLSDSSDFFQCFIAIAIAAYRVVDILDIWRLALSLILPSGPRHRGAKL